MRMAEKKKERNLGLRTDPRTQIPTSPTARSATRALFHSARRKSVLATGGSAQMRGFATGVGSKADIGAGQGPLLQGAGAARRWLSSPQVEWLFGRFSLPLPLSQIPAAP